MERTFRFGSNLATRNFFPSSHAENGRVLARQHAPPSARPFESRILRERLPLEHDQYLSMLGANWAVMALARALEPVKPPLRGDAADSQVRERWTETVLFAHWKCSASASGWFRPEHGHSRGTTALMMAMPDLEKSKLLIDGGANVNARARSNFSALDVAAQYRDSSPRSAFC